MTINKKTILFSVFAVIFILTYIIFFRPVREKDCIGIWKYDPLDEVLTLMKNGEVAFEGSWYGARDLDINYDSIVNAEWPDNVVAKGRYTIQDKDTIIIHWKYASVNSSEFMPLKNEVGGKYDPFCNWLGVMFIRSVPRNYFFNAKSDACYYKETSKTP